VDVARGLASVGERELVVARSRRTSCACCAGCRSVVCDSFSLVAVTCRRMRLMPNKPPVVRYNDSAPGQAPRPARRDSSVDDASLNSQRPNFYTVAVAPAATSESSESLNFQPVLYSAH